MPEVRFRQAKTGGRVAADEFSGANDIIEAQLAFRIERIESVLAADFIVYSGPIDDSAQAFLKAVLDSQRKRRRRLVVLLETNGGYIESAERIANTLRHHYRQLDFIVTTFAMSAGTVLAMSGNNIYMEYAATLGPIDPQVRRPGGERFVPALGYLEQYERIVEKSNAGELSPVEAAWFINSFDAAEMYQYEQARDLSIALLEEWLVRYKFKNWKVTEKRALPVTATMRKERAGAIARKLNDTQHWHSHSRGISPQVLRRDLKLQIEDLDDHPDLRDALAEYSRLLLDYRMRLGHRWFVTNWRGGYHGH